MDVSPDALIANKCLREAVNNLRNGIGYTKRLHQQIRQQQQPLLPPPPPPLMSVLFTSSSLEEKAPGQAGSGCGRALFGQPLAALCGEDSSLPRPIQELLAVLHREGPSTEGIFRRAASGTEFRELREAMDHGADVDLGSQPALLLAVILKDFLRSIPAKLLVTDLYEDWMAAMQKSGKEEKVEELKA
ncbi:T-cell activation Rho GTPase-activating protein-like [Buteo buteo]|uniref:T-cell activation Rho GTPase-activating protein-like n=1 Tax=Buteo buteo TaxID=30397 RepID=UPI003EBEF4BD